MNWNISAWCIRNPIPSIVLFLLLIIVGLYSLTTLAIEEQPNIESPYVSVTVNDNGASPAEIETQISRRVEDAVASVTNVKHIHSTITTGTSLTEIEFEFGTNSDRAATDVREAITKIRQQLPKGIDEPSVSKSDWVPGSSILYTISSNKRSTVDLSWLVENDITQSLMSSSNVGTVLRFGGAGRAINVYLDPVRMEAFGVTADMLNTQLRALNIDLPGGKSELGSTEQAIRALGSVRSIEGLRATRIVLPGNHWVELRSLGTVTDGFLERRHSAMLNRKTVVSFEIIRRRGKNIVDMEKDSERILETIRERMPDLTFERIYSDAKYVKESCSATFEALILGGVLAVIIIWLFLRDARSSLIAAFAMPLSVIPTFAFMHAADFTLNDMSLLGLALVIGILVDDAIVEIENIVRHIDMGKKPYQAAIDAADEIGLAVVATTMAAVVVFLPVAFMGGAPGQLFRQFGLTVAVAVFCSLLVARLVTPVMAAYWLKAKAPKKAAAVNRLQIFYENALAMGLRHRLITVVLGVMFFVASLGLYKALPTSLVSRIDRNQSTIMVELPPGAKLEDTITIVRRINQLIEKRPEVEKIYATMGSQDAVNQGRLIVVLKPKEERKLSQDDFEAALRPILATIPGARISFGVGWGSGNVSVLLTSRDPEALASSAQQLMREMRNIPQLADVRSSNSALRPEMIVAPDFARAAEQGVSVESIARTALVATLGDTEANQPKFDLSDRQIPIMVCLNPKFRHKMSVIGNLKVASNNGKLIPLASVAKMKLDSGMFKIERFDRARQIKIDATYGADYSLGQALNAIHQLPAWKNKARSISDHVSGDVETQQDIFGGFGYAIIAGVILIYAVLVLLFKGFLQPFTIMMALPLSFGGSLIGLFIFKKPIDMYGLIGIVMLMGLVTKNAILLIEYCLAAMHRGVPRTEAIFAAGRTRMRPILMTTTAMIAGMLPIAFAIGAGAEARAPMAMAVVAGLFVSTLLTLIIVPVVFTYMDDLQNFIARVFQHAEDDDVLQLQTTSS